MKIDKDLAEEIMWGDKHLDRTVGDSHRWSTDIYYVFEQDGRHWQFCYDEPATEDQESQWEYEDEIECWEVVPKTVEVVVYERV